MEKLTKEEVIHVAELGRISLSDEEIEKFSYQLKSLLDEINKIKEINLEENDILIAPETNKCVLREDNIKEFENKEKLIGNAPKSFDKFVEVVGVFDE